MKNPLTPTESWALLNRLFHMFPGLINGHDTVDGADVIMAISEFMGDHVAGR